MERHAFRGAINRSYYAAFYAARALLALREVDSSKHSGVIALFQRHFVKAGTVTPDIARALTRAFDRRLETDYGDHVSISAEEASRIQEDAQQFVQECAAVLERLLTER